MMICTAPSLLNGRPRLSVSDAIWEPVPLLSPRLSQLLVSEVGAEPATYAGAVFPKMEMLHELLEVIRNEGLFLCFRAVRDEWLSQVSCPMALPLTSFEGLEIKGWDVATGNGWIAASLEGIFPEQTDGELNSYSLLSDEQSAINCSRANDAAVPDRAPWFPVALLMDVDSSVRLSSLLRNRLL